jgi:NRAMP (natural resistance-associated macrophage protein)-like metal ion transporter
MLMVALMSTVFLLTAFLVRPDIAAVFKGLLWPTFPDGSLLTIVALIGTTVVPYNLFLHSATVKEKWKGLPVGRAIRESRLDTLGSVSLGGVLTMTIIATAASAFYARGITIGNASTMAEQLQPLLGGHARTLFAVGLLAAGITSAITAPLAGAFAIAGVLGWTVDLKNRRFKSVWASILGVGTVLAATDVRPVAAILFAQATNGFLLPVVALFLLIAMNRSDVLGSYRNGVPGNALGVFVIITVTGLSFFQLARVTGIIQQ